MFKALFLAALIDVLRIVFKNNFHALILSAFLKFTGRLSASSSRT